MPCSDNGECETAAHHNSTLADNVEHSNHENKTQECSPFCLCTCCGQSISYEFTLDELKINSNITTQKTETYISSFVSEVFFAIWQPPKIS